MAKPLTADQLVSALQAEGVSVREYKSWRTHNRNSMGLWGPVHGVMLHHTVTSGTASSVDLCYRGHAHLPGPLCHGVIDKEGVCHLVGNGRANHAGLGDRCVLDAVIAERPLPQDKHADTDGNSRFYGFECINLGDGKDPWPAAQVDGMVRASAAILRAHGWGRNGDTSVIGHLEWQPGKIDPRPSPGGGDVTMRALRRRIAERLNNSADWDEHSMPEPQDLWFHTINHGEHSLQAKTFLGRAYQHSMEANHKISALTSTVDKLVDAVTTLSNNNADWDPDVFKKEVLEAIERSGK